MRQGRSYRQAAIACIAFAIVALTPAAALAAYDSSPADGSGSATATGTTSVGHQYSATFTSSFSPAHIQPGEPFTYTARTEALEPDGSPGGCTSGSNSQTSTYDSWIFFRVGPGEDFYTEGSTETASVAANYTNTETFEYICPEVRFTTGPMTVPVSAEQSQSLASGCYQSTIWENGIYFPDGGPSDLQRVDSLSGTVGTLRVGNGLDCAKPGAGAEPTKDAIKFTGADGQVPLDCELLASACEGKALLKAKNKHGRVFYPSCRRCKLATGHFSIPAHSHGHARLKLTPKGKALLRRGGCRHCGKRKTVVTIPAKLVLTSAATGATSVSPIQARGGKCLRC